MFIRLFSYASNELDSKQIVDNILKSINVYIDKVEFVLCKPYWKMSGVYENEVRVVFKNDLTDVQLNTWLYDISDKWLYLGSPITEMLASETTKDCHYIIDGVSMINVILDDK